jgi:DNA-binding protein YbaB
MNALSMFSGGGGGMKPAGDISDDASSSGAAGDAKEQMTPEKAAAMSPEQAAKAMGMDVEEYKLAMKMREKLASALNGIKCTGEKDGVSITFDGNIKPVDISIKEEMVSVANKEKLQSAVLHAWTDAMGKSTKQAQNSMMTMQKDIAKEMGLGK